MCEVDIYEEVDVNEENYNLLAKKPMSTFDNDFVNKMYKSQNLYGADREQVKIVTISDLHVDYNYLEGSSNECGKPLCCRANSGKPISEDKKAGKWGDYKCDLNEIALDNMLSYIRNDIKPDVVIWGGDSIPHNTASVSIDENIDIVKKVT